MLSVHTVPRSAVAVFNELRPRRLAAFAPYFIITTKRTLHAKVRRATMSISASVKPGCSLTRHMSLGDLYYPL